MHIKKTVSDARREDLQYQRVPRVALAVEVLLRNRMDAQAALTYLIHYRSPRGALYDYESDRVRDVIEIIEHDKSKGFEIAKTGTYPELKNYIDRKLPGK